MSKRFEQQLAELGIALTHTQFNQFDKYYEMLVEWNKVMISPVSPSTKK